MLDKKKIEEIKRLRKQGKTYDEIAIILKVSKTMAYKYGKEVDNKMLQKYDDAVKAAGGDISQAHIDTLRYFFGDLCKNEMKHKMLQKYDDAVKAAGGDISQAHIDTLRYFFGDLRKNEMKLKKRKK